jgi:hypothetical protein
LKKISKNDAETLSKLNFELTAEHNKYNLLVADFNADILAVVEKFKAERESELIAIETNIESLSTALKNISVIQSDKMDDYISERSERWHDTDSGLNFTEWKEDWEEFGELVCIAPDYDFINGISVSYTDGVEMPKFNR